MAVALERVFLSMWSRNKQKQTRFPAGMTKGEDSPFDFAQGRLYGMTKGKQWPLYVFCEIALMWMLCEAVAGKQQSGLENSRCTK